MRVLSTGWSHRECPNSVKEFSSFHIPQHYNSLIQKYNLPFWPGCTGPHSFEGGVDLWFNLPFNFFGPTKKEDLPWTGCPPCWMKGLGWLGSGLQCRVELDLLSSGKAPMVASSGAIRGTLSMDWKSSLLRLSFTSMHGALETWCWGPVNSNLHLFQGSSGPGKKRPRRGVLLGWNWS